MNPTIRNTLAVIGGLVAAYIVNMSIIFTTPMIVPPPPGADMMTSEGIREAMEQFEFKHYLMPFLAHALGTLAGGFAASLIAASHKMIFALVIGTVFLALGIGMISLVGGPMMFMVCDLGIAFIPMALIGGWAGTKLTAKPG